MLQSVVVVVGLALRVRDARLWNKHAKPDIELEDLLVATEEAGT